MFTGVVEALLRGQGSANQLKKRLQDPIPNDVAAESLAETVVDSFSHALSLLTNTTTGPSHLPLAPPKRNRAVDEAWSTHDSPIHNCPDGFVWRKYGQKNIKTSPHYQRSYYKCAYLKECNAKKRVEKIQDDPPLYQTKYLGQHTCQHDQAAVFKVISDSTRDELDGSRMIRFDTLDQQCDPVFPSTGPVNNHQEIVNAEAAMDGQMNHDNYCDQFFADDVQFWPLDSPPSLSGDLMTGSSSSFYDQFQF